MSQFATCSDAQNSGLIVRILAISPSLPVFVVSS